MSYQTIDELRSQLGGGPKVHSPEYVEKMMHPLPPFKSVKREQFILQHCVGKRVLEFGASGPLHEAMVKVATYCYGVDRVDGSNIVGFDLDDVSQPALPTLLNVELIVCGEVLEHLSNPGWFLTRLRRQFPNVPVILSVPNAFAATGMKWIKKGTENVNKDHVAWYSPKTLSVLLERAGYDGGDLFWYGGTDATAEGLLVVTE